VLDSLKLSRQIKSTSLSLITFPPQILQFLFLSETTMPVFYGYEIPVGTGNISFKETWTKSMIVNFIFNKLGVMSWMS